MSIDDDADFDQEVEDLRSEGEEEYELQIHHRTSEKATFHLADRVKDYELTAMQKKQLRHHFKDNNNNAKSEEELNRIIKCFRIYRTMRREYRVAHVSKVDFKVTGTLNRGKIQTRACSYVRLKRGTLGKRKYLFTNVQFFIEADIKPPSPNGTRIPTYLAYCKDIPFDSDNGLLFTSDQTKRPRPADYVRASKIVELIGFVKRDTRQYLIRKTGCLFNELVY